MTEPNLSARRFFLAAAVLGGILAAGAVAFRLVLHESWLHSFYRAVISASLTGLDSSPRGTGGRIITMLLVIAGVALFAYVAGAVAEALVGGVVTGAWVEKRRRRAIEQLRDHYIICGYGRVGRRVAEEFRHAGVAYVVVDFNQTSLEAAREHGDHYIEGNGTNDDDLRAAGLEHARGLVASSDSDADNLYISLSARSARPELLIVARASTDEAARKLQLAGADRVVQPYLAAGRVMANLVLKPQVTAFLDAVTTAMGPDLRFEEIEVLTGCGAAGCTLRDLDVRKRSGALIVGVRKGDGSFDTTPGPDAVLQTGDVVIAAGTTEELRSLEEIFAPREAVAG